MSEELESLGGGDAKVAKLETICRIAKPSNNKSRDKSEVIVVATENNYVQVR